MPYVLIPSRLWPQTASELYRILAAIPAGLRVRVVDIRDGQVFWVPL